MKKIIINTTTGKTEEVDLTAEEMAQREADRLDWEQEQAKPKPPTVEEQLAEKDDKILELKEKQAVMNRLVDDNSTAQQELLELLIDMGVI